MWQSIKNNKDLFIVAIASFFIGFGVASFFTGSEKSGDSEIKEDISSLPPLPFDGGDATKPSTALPSIVSQATGGEELVVENQRAGDRAHIKRVSLKNAGWVVIRESRDGGLGNILGAGWFPVGTLEEVDVSLQRGMTGGEKYHALLYADTLTDKKFDHTIDMPLKTSAGVEIQTTFQTIANPAGE